MLFFIRTNVVVWCSGVHPQTNDDCRECMIVTTEQTEAFEACLEGYTIDALDPCSPASARPCCLIEIGADCQSNDLFVAYSECYIEEHNGWSQCPTPLTCDQTMVVVPAEEVNAAGRLASPLNGADSFVVGMILALVGTAIVQ